MAATKTAPRTHEEFVFRVRAPSLSYHFGIEHDLARREWRPFDAWEAIYFVTECVWPERFKGRVGKGILWPEPALVDHKLLEKDDVRRKWIGFVRATKGEFEASIYLPPPACWRIGEAMKMGLVESMLTNGPVEPRGMYRVASVSFHGEEFDPVAYVG